MFLRLANSPRPYAWGSLSGISDLLGTRASGRPEAELWFGTHGGSPTWLVDHDEGYATLNEFVFSQPERMVSRGDSLPFLLKVLAADQPLSLQAHPTSTQAREGFERENAAGIRLDAPERNYRDDQPKPELIVCVSDEFVGLSGFRPLTETLRQFKELVRVPESAPALSQFIADFEREASSSHEGALRWAVTRLLSAPADGVPIARDLVKATRDFDRTGLEIVDTVREIADLYPDDPGVVIAALLNRVTLTRGAAMFLPAGNIHAYLHGVGIELMNSSDNVLRGGLTNKHVDVQELTRVVNFVELDDPRLAPETLTTALVKYEPEGAGFVLYRFNSHADSGAAEVRVPVDVASIVLCTTGTVTLQGALGQTRITRGEAVFVSASEEWLVCEGAGEAFIATSVG